jgi:hypothetical protein
MFHQEIPLKDVFATLQAELQGDSKFYINNLYQRHFAALHRLLHARMVLMCFNECH